MAGVAPGIDHTWNDPAYKAPVGKQVPTPWVGACVPLR